MPSRALNFFSAANPSSHAAVREFHSSPVEFQPLPAFSRHSASMSSLITNPKSEPERPFFMTTRHSAVPFARFELP